MRLFVGNISYTMTDAELRQLFEKHGEVLDAVVARDPEQKSKGFGFVTMDSDRAGRRAIVELHEATLDGRVLRVEISTSAPRRMATRA